MMPKSLVLKVRLGQIPCLSSTLVKSLVFSLQAKSLVSRPASAPVLRQCSSFLK